MRRMISISAILLLAASLPGSSGAQGLKGRELLGVRLGGAVSPGAVRDAFGDGSELELHFTEGLGAWFGIDVALSMHNFGRARTEITDPTSYYWNMKPEAEVYSLTVGFMAMRDISQRISLASDAGIGLYTINAVIPAGIYEGRVYRNQLGLYGGMNLYYALNSRGLSLDIGAKYHYVFSGDDPLQVLHVYTGEDRLGFFQMTLGIVFFTR